MSLASTPLNITIDFSSAMTHSAGIARYTRELVTALQSRPDAVRLRIVHHRVRQPTTGAPHALPGTEFPFHARGWRLFCLFAPSFATRRLIGSGPLDVFHAPDYVAPHLHVPLVLTIHDLTCITHPQYHSRLNWLYQRVALPATARRAARILADSVHTASEIERVLGISRDRIAVVYPGLRNDKFTPTTPTSAHLAVQQMLGLTRPYVLGLGTLEPRKNLQTLLRAFSRIAGEFPHDLVLVGKPGWGDTRLHELASDLGIRERVHFSGFIADDHLPVLYSGADAFVFPSHYEGFGFPVLEAMACSTPVICSDNSSLPEVGGDAVRYAHADDSATFADELRQVLNSPQLAEEMRSRGLSQAARFTWQKTADQVIDAYRHVRDTAVRAR